MSRKNIPAPIVGSLDCLYTVIITLVLNAVLIFFYMMSGKTDAVTVYGTLHDFSIFFVMLLACGIPFSACALSARSDMRRDYKSVVHIRRITLLFTVTMGAVMTVLVFVFSGPLASLILGAAAPDGDRYTMMTALRILSPSFTVIAFMYSLRGFYQGLNEIRTDNRTQVIYSILKCVFIYAFMMLIIHSFKYNRALSCYAIGWGTLLAGAIAAGFIWLFDKVKLPRLRKQAKAQLIPMTSKKKLLGDLFSFSMPSFVTALLLGVILLSSTLFAIPLLMMAGKSYIESRSAYAVIRILCPHLTNLILLAAFLTANAYIPYIANALYNGKEELLNTRIEKAYCAYFYFALPALTVFVFIGGAVFNVFYGSELLSIGSSSMAYSGLVSLLSGAVILTVYIMMTLHLTKELIIYTVIGTILKCVFLYILTMKIGTAGIQLSSVIALAVILFLGMAKISNKQYISFARTGFMILRMFIGCLAMNGAFALIKYIGYNGLWTDRVYSSVHLMMMIFAGTMVYIFITRTSHVPQAFTLHSKKDRNR